MPDGSTDWTKLLEFHAVLLTESYVLSWEFLANDLLIDVDLCLASEHPFYETPRPAEKKCIRPAIIEFPACDSASIDGSSRDAATVREAIEHFGKGSITGLQRTGDGAYEIIGEFGCIQIRADRPLLRLKTEFI